MAQRLAWFLLPSAIKALMVVGLCANLMADPKISGRDPISVFLASKKPPAVPTDQILRGGPPIDGIPSIDHPHFISAGVAKFLREEDLVLGIELEGEAHAYPIKILNWHEIVNDTLRGTPLVISYCPLCGSGMAFERKVKDRTLTFGVSGLLYNSDMVMYDWETHSLWSQILSEAIAGELTGASLRQIPVHYSEWREWKASHPETLVLSDQTGHFRDYERDPYAGYDRSERLYFPVEGEDRRLKKKELVYGIRFGNFQKAYPLKALRAEKKIQDKIGEKSVVIEWKDGSPVSNFQDTNKIPGVVAYWFAWSAFFPKTELYSAKTR